ncbi:Leucine-rich repeat domain superfamily [Sesbania bispinosa]|nr:Leucine-rich repeat domain superfamily [Sesbania bispinosa]
MKKLRLLQLDRVDLTGDYGYLSKVLRWVNWQRSTFRYIPDDFDLGHLLVLDLKYSNIKQLWKETMMLEKLKILNLSHSRYLKNTPDFSKLPNLEKLILKDCPNLSEVHESIGDLKNLILINLKDCTSLSNLPRKIYQLKSVKTLILSGCSKIDKLEEDIEQMESLTTLIAEGLARDVFTSLLWSWMSPTMNPMSHSPLFGSMSSSLAFMDVQNNNLDHLSPMISGLSKLQTVWVQCDTEFQLSEQLLKILDDANYDGNYVSDLPSTSHAIASQTLRFQWIGIGSYHKVLDALSNNTSEGLASNGSIDFSLPGDNFPYWLSHTGEGHSVYFEVPHIIDWFMKGMILCVVYSSTTGNLADDFLISVLIVNYTKCTIQIYKRDTTISFNEEDWQGIISNLGHEDKVEIYVVYGQRLTVMKTVVYLIHDKSINVETEPPKKSFE